MPPPHLHPARAALPRPRQAGRRAVASFLKRLVVDQDLGKSFVGRQSVNEQVLNAAPLTASIAVGGLMAMLLMAFPIGILSALRPRSLLDRGAMTFSLAS